ncbi:MAG: redoxin domain-containing protein [Methanoregula sp.]
MSLHDGLAEGPADCPHAKPHHSRHQNSSTGNPMIQAAMVQPGDPARNFSLKDQNDKTFDLYEQAGKRVLLSFHPLAWTDFCAAQMKSLEENREKFISLNCMAVGISVDSRPCKQAWAKSLSITHTPLLCDFWPHGAAAMKYGIFRDENGFSERANIMVDEKQKVVFVKIYPVHSVPDIQEIVGFLER